jgi:potassium efflux system protein
MPRQSQFQIARGLRSLILLAALVIGPAALAADPSAQEKVFAGQIAEWTKALDSARAELGKSGLHEKEFEDVRAQAEKVHDDSLLAWRDAQTQAEATRKLFEALGPAPKEGEPAESQDVAGQRESLKARLAVFESRMKQADLVAAQASDIMGTFMAASRERLASRLLTRGPYPVLPGVWAKAIPEFVTTMAGLVAAPLEWLASGAFAERGVYSLAVLSTGLFLAALIGWPLRKWLLRRFGRDPTLAQPTYMRRVLAAAVEGVGHGLLPSLAVAAVYATFLSLEMLSAHLLPIASGVCLGLVFFILASSLSRAALAPDMPDWQLAPFHPENARVINRTITALAGVAAFIIFVHESVNHEQMSVEFRTVFNFVTNSTIAAGVLFLLRRRLWEWTGPGAVSGVEAEAATATEETISEELQKVRRRVLPVLRWVMMLVAITIPAAGLLGYYRLSAYLTSKLVWTAALIGALWLLHELLREVIELLLTRDERLSPRVRHALTLTDRGSRVLQFWLLFGVNIVMVLIAVPLALPIWGVSWHGLSGWLKSSEIGLYIERLTFSISDIATAFLVFAGILLVTRWIQRSLEERIFPQTRLDAGVRHSLKAAVGYVGLVVAAVMAISALGLNLTNLAVVLGALSVGIGFGLQAIASNFVSGLILLIERPVKVGDWIRVGDKEGFVKRISVRSTEIETFQRANVIIPNSEILSTSIVNLTHRDHFGRIDVPVGVAYGSDVEKVKEVLTRCGAAHPAAVKSPPPQALLLKFGDSSLDFELRVHVDRIERYWTIVSDLHYAIERAFREAGIELPFPQTDIHLRDLDRIEGMIAGRRATSENGETPAGRKAKKGLA